jgi:ABC-type multidrug transport system fused ATPase/permease subunit
LAEVLSGSMSALIIAHRLSTIRHLCTKFIVLKGSDALEEGEPQIEAIGSSFEELYIISPTFRRLADDQDVVVKNASPLAPPAVLKFCTFGNE